MNTRDLEQLSATWSDEDLTAALQAFIERVGRLPESAELRRYLPRRSVG
jgi:hypothetical protein